MENLSIAQAQEKIEELENELYESIEREENLKRMLAETEADRSRAGKRVAEADAKAEQIKKETDYRYFLALKALKNFTDKCKRISVAPAEEENKRLIDLFADLLQDLTFENSEEKFKKASSFFGSESSSALPADDYVFDLEEAMNPTEELSLEELCKELGVYRG
ncbi:MAG TPA: hypothetical protein DDY77_06550 [Clostridiales bacterium]|nr:hypothetical protein [Clostridiales bacterium]